MELAELFLPPRTVSLPLLEDTQLNGHMSFSEAVLGIIPGSFANLMTLLLPNYLNSIMLEFSDNMMVQRGAFVCGLIPGTTAYLSGKVFLGDYIVSVDNTSTSLDLFEDSIRYANRRSFQCVQITLQSLRIDKLAALFGKPIVSDYVIQFGENMHWNALCNSLSLFPLAVFCCGGHDNQENSSQKVIYSHPLSDQRLQNALEGVIPCLIMLSDDYAKHSTITSMQVHLENEEMSVAVYNAEPFGCIVLALPSRLTDISACYKALQIMLRVILFYSGTFEKAFSVNRFGTTEETDRIISVILFEILCPDLLFEELQMSTDMSWSLFQTIFTELPHLPLPETVKVTVDSVLTDFESSDFSDPFLIPPHRRFVVMGSCLFYKGFMVASHLNTTDLIDVGLFLRHRFILSALSFSPQMASTLCGSLLGGPSTAEAVSSPRGEQSLIWCEVFPTHRNNTTESDDEPCWPTFGYSEPTGARYVLLVIPKKQTFLAVLLETNGLPSINSEEELNPDSVIVREVSKSLGKLENIGLPAFCEQGLGSSLGVKLVSADTAYPSASLSLMSGKSARRSRRSGSVAFQSLAVANVQRFSSALRGLLVRTHPSMSFSSDQIQSDSAADGIENQTDVFPPPKKVSVLTKLTKAFKRKFLRKGDDIMSHTSSYNDFVNLSGNDDFDAANYVASRGTQNVEEAPQGNREKTGVPGSYTGSGTLSTSEGPGRDEGIPIPLANALPTLFDMSEAHLHSGDMSSRGTNTNRGALSSQAVGVVQDVLFSCSGQAFGFIFFDRNQGFYVCPSDTYSPPNSSIFHRRVSDTFLHSTLDMINMFDTDEELEEAAFVFPTDPVEWFDYDPSVLNSIAMNRSNQDKSQTCSPVTCSPKAFHAQILPSQETAASKTSFDFNPINTQEKAYWCSLRKFPRFQDKEDRGANCQSSVRMFALCGNETAIQSTLDLGLQFAFDLAL